MPIASLRKFAIRPRQIAASSPKSPVLQKPTPTNGDQRKTFRSRADLQNACNHIIYSLGDSFSGYTVKNLGFEPPLLGEDNAEDGQTQTLTIEFNTKDANEGWTQFLRNLEQAKNGLGIDRGNC